MKDKPTIIDLVVNLDAQRRLMLIQSVRALPDGLYHIQVLPRRGTASQRQHAYYRGLVVPMIVDEMQAQGNDWITAASVHNKMAEMFLRVTIPNQKTGEIWADETRSSGDLDTAEMADFIEKVRGWAAQEMDVQIPDPDPMWRFNKVTKEKVTA